MDVLRGMLHEFLTEVRADLLGRCAERVAARNGPMQSVMEMEHGMPNFLDQLITTLRAEEGADERPESAKVVAAENLIEPGTEMGVSATRHGREMSQSGFRVDEVVRSYGDLCQEITGLAIERDVRISAEEFRVLNRCLDNGIADSVTEFTYQREALLVQDGAEALNERLGFLAHELRNRLQAATLAIGVIKSGLAGLSGPTGGLLDRSLVAMGNLIDRSLAEVRMTAGMPARYQLISVADFISDLKISAGLEAGVHECRLTVASIDPTLAVDVDRDLLFSAVGNLLQNAFKFSKPGSEVKLNAYAETEHVFITVEDSGSGLTPGEAERIFLPFTQSGSNKSGAGLGLAISRRGTEINKGVLSVRTAPGAGCTFVIELPRHALPKAV